MTTEDVCEPYFRFMLPGSLHTTGKWKKMFGVEVSGRTCQFCGERMEYYVHPMCTIEVCSGCVLPRPIKR